MFSNELLALQAWQPIIVGKLINLPNWSISNEVFFYFLFPRIIAPLKNRVGHIALIIFTLWFAAAAGASLWWAQYGHHLSVMYEYAQVRRVGALAGMYIIKFNPLLHLGEFVSGILLYYLWERTHSSVSVITRTSLLFFSAAIFVLLVVLQHMVPTVFYVLGLSVLAWHPLIFACASIKKGILVHPILIFLGQASYALYLVHFLVMQILNQFVPNLFQRNTPFLPSMLIVVVLSALVAIPAHLFIERPYRKKILCSYDKRKSVQSTPAVYL